jgi:hypothetical protein
MICLFRDINKNNLKFNKFYSTYFTKCYNIIVRIERFKGGLTYEL